MDPAYLSLDLLGRLLVLGELLFVSHDAWFSHVEISSPVVRLTTPRAGSATGHCVCLAGEHYRSRGARERPPIGEASLATCGVRAFLRPPFPHLLRKLDYVRLGIGWDEYQATSQLADVLAQTTDAEVFVGDINEPERSTRPAPTRAQDFVLLQVAHCFTRRRRSRVRSSASSAARWESAGR